jgi:hypothetical protein
VGEGRRPIEGPAACFIVRDHALAGAPVENWPQVAPSPRPFHRTLNGTSLMPAAFYGLLGLDSMAR